LRVVVKKIRVEQSKRWGKSYGNGSFNVWYQSKQSRPIGRVTKIWGEVGGAFGTR